MQPMVRHHTRRDSTSVRHTEAFRLCLFVILALSLGRPTHARQEEPQSPEASASATSSASSSPDATPGTATDNPADTKSSKRPPSKPDRLFGVLPNYSTVENATQIPPITAKATFRMAAQNSFDPFVFPFVGVVAALGQVERQEQSLGRGPTAYGKRYATALADNSLGSFLTTAVFPGLLRQDPRYFELGTGSLWHRIGYAASRSVITRSRSGRAQFNYSDIGGNAAAAALSNVYYPADSRSPADTLTRWGAQVMWDTVSNELKEFWPDIRNKLHKP